MSNSEKLNFNDLPEAISRIINKLDRIERIVLEKQEERKPEKKYLTVDALREYVFAQTGKKPARQTVYGWVCRSEIQNIKRGRTVLFETVIVDKWLIENKRQSLKEI